MDSLYENAGNMFNTAANKAAATPGYAIVFIIALVFGVGIALFYYLRPKAEDVTVMGPYMLKGASTGGRNSTQETIFDQGQLNQKLGINFTFSSFIYMDDTNAERIPLAGPKGDFRFKPLILILGVGTVTVDPIHQMARVTIEPLSDRSKMKRTGGVDIDIENFVAARWNQLLISVEGRSVDVYLNGKLAKSALLENVPVLYPIGVILETVPDFSGQIGLFQAWPRRLTEPEVVVNYKRNTDTRGKPRIPEKGLNLKDMFDKLGEQLCGFGFCGFRFNVGPMQYIDYDFA